MHGFKDWLDEEETKPAEPQGMRDRFAAKLGKFLKKLALAGAIPSTMATVAAIINSYAGGNPIHTNVLSLLAAGTGGISLLLDKIGQELFNSSDPKHKKMLEELEKLKEEYGWGWRKPTPEGIKRRRERASETKRIISMMPDGEEKSKLLARFADVYGKDL